MTTRRDFLASATTVAALGPAYPDLTPILRRPSRHRQVFGIRNVHDGGALVQIRNSLNVYEFARNEGPGALHVVAVLYGLAVALALDDHAWTVYDIAGALAIEGDPVARARTANGNPFLRLPASAASAGSSDPRAAAQDASLGGLIRRGTSVLVCDHALTEFALTLKTVVARAPGSVDSTRRSLHAHLITGTTLVPAGVAALNDAQEARYTYVAA